jgi:coproporphyrinogen III oxidase
MTKTRTVSENAETIEAVNTIHSLQKYFAENLQTVCSKKDQPLNFKAVEWLRNDGRHGGGVRLEIDSPETFNQASLNFSHIHYSDEPSRSLKSATALSCIVHPRNPMAPSLHLHVSYTDSKVKGGYWRLMADLNPSHLIEMDRELFLREIDVFPDHVLRLGLSQGDKYFFIPALGRTRGVAHFYLEEYTSGNFRDDLELTEKFAKKSIDVYSSVLEKRLNEVPPDLKIAQETQLWYHTLYFFQVLTLDRGTTSGLLVHNQNDVGILGSLPSHVNRNLLIEWISKVPSPQDQLVRDLIACLEPKEIAPVNEPTKANLANAIRLHYKEHPDSLDLQASGFTIPPTVGNHMTRDLT